LEDKEIFMLLLCNVNMLLYAMLSRCGICRLRWSCQINPTVSYAKLSSFCSIKSYVIVSVIISSPGSDSLQSGLKF